MQIWIIAGSEKWKNTECVFLCVWGVIDKGLWHLWAKKSCRRNSSHSPRNAFEKKNAKLHASELIFWKVYISFHPIFGDKVFYL